EAIVNGESHARIALIGMMGSGKSTVGRRLASELGWAFIDTDAEIVRTQGRSIADIFRDDGEEAFRNLETAALRQALTPDEVVIATGGGVVLRPENRDLLARTCWVVWLRATEEEYIRRVAGNARRPLLAAGEDLPA